MLPVEPGYAASTPSALPASGTSPAQLTPAQQQTLAQRYAPILYFHPDEKNLLQNPDTFLEQSTLRKERDFWGDKELAGRGDVDPNELAKIGPENADADGQIFLDHRNEDLGDGIRAGDLSNSRNLYQYDPKTNTLTYFFFYSYNDGPPGLGDAQNHEGDWERMTVQLDGNFQPTEVRYAAHNGLEIARPWSEAPKEDGRPVGYVGLGSHATYPETGEWATQVPGIPDVASRSGTRFDLGGQSPVDVTTQPWYGSHVLWGERGSAQEAGIGDTAGPTGPSPEKGPVLSADPNRRPIRPDNSGPLPDRWPDLWPF